MLEILKIIHFLSFTVAIGAGVSNMIIGARMATIPPDAVGPVVGIRMSFGKISTIGLILLWISGLTMVAMVHGAAVAQNTAYLYKMAVVLILTAVSIMANITVAKAKASGTPPDATRMKRLGVAATTTGIIALILAVIAFT